MPMHRIAPSLGLLNTAKAVPAQPGAAGHQGGRQHLTKMTPPSATCLCVALEEDRDQESLPLPDNDDVALRHVLVRVAGEEQGIGI